MIQNYEQIIPVETGIHYTAAGKSLYQLKRVFIIRQQENHKKTKQNYICEFDQPLATQRLPFLS